MEIEKSRQKKEKKHKTKDSAFIAYAIFVFSALAIGLVVILLRSKA